MVVNITSDTAERVEKLRKVIELAGFEITTEELVDRLMDDGLEVSLYRVGFALRDPLPEPTDEAA